MVVVVELSTIQGTGAAVVVEVVVVAKQRQFSSSQRKSLVQLDWRPWRFQQKSQLQVDSVEKI